MLTVKESAMSAATVTPPPAQPAATPAPPAHAVQLMTADEFMAGPGGETFVDLVDGFVEPQPMPHHLHGTVCFNVTMAVGRFVEENDLGRVMINDTHVRVGRNPDRLRGADVLYVSYTHLPRGPQPDGVMDPPFELVFEVRSPSNSWPDQVRKCFEYLDAGVQVVVLLDPDTQTASVYRSDVVQETRYAADALALPDVLPGFSVPVARLFKH